jgi:diguanylate cyclase (GGDEF)-like protein
MPSNFTIFMIAAFFCVVLVLVIMSLVRSGIPGVRAWGIANALGAGAFLLYAFGTELPPLIAYETANGTYAGATAAILVGFRRFFRRRVHLPTLGAGVALLVACIALFHYRYDSFALRTATVSVFHGAVALAIALTVYRARRSWSSHYVYQFTTVMALIVAAGHAARAAVYLANANTLTSLLQPTPLNVFFVAAGTLVLPVLTLGGVMMAHDSMMAKAEHAANRDFLTGAWSRRAFFELAEREIMRIRRTGSMLSLLVLDIDHFKIINDRDGHAVGDQVLIDVVLKAETALRGADCFARLGGEEFAVLLPDTDRAAALLVAERLRTMLAKPAAAGNPYMKTATPDYTVSIGLAMLRDGETLEELIMRADAALYSAKATGRNRVACEADGIVES